MMPWLNRGEDTRTQRTTAAGHFGQGNTGQTSTTMAGSDASQIGGPGTTTDQGVRMLHRAAEWVAGAAEMLAVTADSVGRQLELGMSKEMAAAYLEHPKIEVQSNSARAAVLRKYIYIETLNTTMAGMDTVHFRHGGGWTTRVHPPQKKKNGGRTDSFQKNK